MNTYQNSPMITPPRTAQSKLDILLPIVRRATKFIWPGFATYGLQYGPKRVRELHDTPPELGTLENPPKISIVIPSYNQGVFLESCLKSLVNQNYPNLELICIDGGSADVSVDIIKKYCTKLAYWCSKSDQGQANAINKGFAKSSGDIMAWLNSDDQLLPGTLSRIARYFALHPEVDAVYGNRVVVDKDGYEVGRWILPPHDDTSLTWLDMIPQESLFWRRNLYERIGGKLDESFHFAMDWDLLLRFRNAGAKLVRLPFFIGLFRMHPAQKTLVQMDSTGYEEMQRLRRRNLGYTPSRLSVSVCSARHLILARIVEIMWQAGLLNYR